MFAGNSLKTKQHDNYKVTDSLEMFKVELELKVLPVLFFFLMFCFLYKLLPKFNCTKKIELIIQNLFQVNYRLTRSMNLISLILIFYSLYHMVFLRILTNGVEANKVVVNTTGIALTNEDLVVTRK